MKIILASGSPRRREILSNIVTDFVCAPADVDEDYPASLAPEEVPSFLARKKAAAVASAHPDDIVIGADTVVICGGVILGKPTDEADAARMLRMLSGKVHSVVTGCAVVRGGETSVFSRKTEVEFYSLGEDEIAAYVRTGEPMDKAGAYGIQGKGGVFVKKISGDYYNVVGLPAAELYRALRGTGATIFEDNEN